jgi:hypothetical protein
MLVYHSGECHKTTSAVRYRVSAQPPPEEKYIDGGNYEAAQEAYVLAVQDFTTAMC